MKILFAGTPSFAAAALAALCEAGHEVVAVLTQPQRAAGRGMVVRPAAVAQEAARRGLHVLDPPSLKDAAVHARLARFDAEVFVVAAYGMLLPQAVLDIPPKGCLNIHASLLPRWRGAAPVQRAIEAGDRETGVTIMRMDAGLDTGPVLLERRIGIAHDETSGTLFARLAGLGAAAIVEALARLDELTPIPQAAQGVTVAKKVLKAEAAIDWSLPAAVIERRVRAFDPFPGTETSHRGLKLKIWRATPVDSPSHPAPGQVLEVGAAGLLVATGTGALWLTELQRPGGKRLPAADFLRGHPIVAGERLA